MEQMMEQFEGMPGLPDGFLERFLELADTDELIDMVVPIYVANLDEEAIDGLIAFAKSSSGRAFYAAQPQIQKESMEAGAEWGRELAMEAMNDVGY